MWVFSLQVDFEGIVHITVVDVPRRGTNVQ